MWALLAPKRVRLHGFAAPTAAVTSLPGPAGTRRASGASSGESEAFWFLENPDSKPKTRVKVGKGYSPPYFFSAAFLILYMVLGNDCLPWNVSMRNADARAGFLRQPAEEVRQESNGSERE